ncbi:hypothetical protein [Parvularcula maris]|uniref:Uncharacterized protein n=1 Tax=Parvularcula maris TaxID=2965077 RepID=A0A9X2RIN3_9PROT|nr:hypothetical protein [Parvularcula maris]MCQ8186255.1 hypothetical protein [Parvularcula maris]
MLTRADYEAEVDCADYASVEQCSCVKETAYRGQGDVPLSTLTAGRLTPEQQKLADRNVKILTLAMSVGAAETSCGVPKAETPDQDSD